MSDERRLILLTGCTKGLGLAMTRGFVAAGQTVIGCGRDAGALELLRTEFGQPHGFFVCDVADDQAVQAMAEQVLQEHGVPDLLINNAGVMNHPRPLWEVPAAEFGQVVDVNIKGITNVIRHFVPSMIERGSGVVINFSSGWGRTTSPNVAPYCATKWAVEGLSDALAKELPEGLGCIALNPGIIDTAMLRKAVGEIASSHHSPEVWAEKAVNKILGFTAADNGRKRTI